MSRCLTLVAAILALGLVAAGCGGGYELDDETRDQFVAQCVQGAESQGASSDEATPACEDALAQFEECVADSEADDSEGAIEECAPEAAAAAAESFAAGS